jgi:hypothetical protein
VQALRTLVLAIALTGCANLRTGHEFDYGADFQSYETYAWVTDELTLIGAGSGNPRVRNETNEKLIRAAIDRELAERGFQKVEMADAELVVTFAVGLREEIRIEGADTTYGLLAFKGSTPKYYEGSLTIDLFARATRRHVWHGWGRESLDVGADAKVVIDEAVGEIMKPFPPEKSSR